MNNLALVQFEDLERITCPTCGVFFASPVVSLRRKDGDRLCCPNGHGIWWTTTEAMNLRKDIKNLEDARAKIARDLEWQKAQTRMAEERLAKEQRKAKRIAKRISCGVCPCCNRTFQNLQQHMSTQHKDFELEDQSLKEIRS